MVQVETLYSKALVKIIRTQRAKKGFYLEKEWQKLKVTQVRFSW